MIGVTGQGKDDCEGGCRLAGGAGPPLSGRDTHNPGQSALCARMDRHCGDNVLANHSILNGPRQGWCSIHRNEFSAEVRLGMDWDLIIGWVGDTRAVGTSWRVEQWGGVGQKVFQVESLLQTSNFPWQSVFLRLSDAAIPSLMSNGAFYRARVEWESACLYLPLRQIQSCRDLNPPRPACKNNLSMFLRFL